VVGTYLFPEVFPLLDSPFGADARIVHIDLDNDAIAKNFPVDVALAADPKPTLTELAGLLSGLRGDCGGAAVPAYRAECARRREPGPDSPLIELFAAKLARQASAGLVVFDEALTASGALAAWLPASAPGSVHVTRGGSLGVGIPGAIGVKIARPEAEVVGFAGDGGSMYTIQALWTAARYGIAARFVVCNNRRYHILDSNIERYWTEREIPAHGYPDSFDLSHPEIDFCRLAGSLGVPATRVDKPAQVEDAVGQMLAHAGPFLVDLDTTTN
jgi:benzoylformate decarboxylase